MTSGSATRDSRQAKAAAMRAEAARAEARRRALIVGAAVLAVIVVAIAIFVLVHNTRRDEAAAAGGTPGNFDANNSIIVGAADAPVTLAAYEDFQCPVCNQFEQLNATQIDAWVKAGTVKVAYRPVSILDRMSSTNYSTRSLNAVAAVVDADPAVFPAFHKLLFANQPEENSAGLSDAKLIELAVQAGASKAAIEPAINDEAYQGWTVRATEQASKDGLTGTPYVLVNGTVVTEPSAANLKAAVDKAVAAAK